MSTQPPAAAKPKKANPLLGWAVAALMGFALGCFVGAQFTLYVIGQARDTLRLEAPAPANP